LERCATAYGPDTAVVYKDRRITYSEQIARIRQTGRGVARPRDDQG